MADICVGHQKQNGSLREGLQRNIPEPALLILAHFRRLIVRTTYSNTEHWRARAHRTTGSKVLWGNDTYNQMFREIQERFLRRYVEGLRPGACILDVGCGVGDVSRMMLSMHSGLTIDGLDLPEMIAAATRECPLPRIRYIASTAEDYFDPSKSYDLVVSSGCISMITEIPKLERAMRNAVMMTRPGGLVIMMEPFHNWRYLARANYGSGQAIQFVSALGFRLIEQTGALFWPYQPWLTRSAVPAAAVHAWFAQGERLLHRLGTARWADYHFLVFARNS